MKIKLSLVSLLSCLSMAHGASLLYGLDFNELGTSSGPSFTNKGTGLVAIQATSSNYHSYNAGVGVPLNDGGYNHVYKQNTFVAGTFKMQDITNSLGAKTETGFSLGLHMYYSATGSNWTNALEFQIGSEIFQLQKTSSNNLTLYNNAGVPVGGNHSIAYNTGEWFHLGMNVTEGKIEFFINGVSALSLASSSISGNLNGVSGANGLFSGYDRKGNNLAVDNVVVYDAPLSSNQWKYLSANPMETDLVPEPATAVLGFLGLSGLMLRRRRS